jgi:hypothetical protein
MANHEAGLTPGPGGGFAASRAKADPDEMSHHGMFHDERFCLQMT